MEEKEQEKIVNLLKKLEGLEEFRLWRDEVAKPIIAQLEADLNNADQMDEVILRAKLKYKALVQELFYNVFESVRALEEK